MTNLKLILFSLALFYSGLVTSQNELAQYNIEQADKTIYLQAALNEISGLTFSSSQNQIIAINDELGVIYHLNSTNGNIVKSTLFAKKGDYEGIELVDNDIYIINSQGELYQSSLQDQYQTKKIVLPFKKRNDIEGLAYLVSSRKLLIACKAWMKFGSEDFNVKHKSIYSFDLKTQKLDESPYLIIDPENLVKFYKDTQKLFSKGSKSVLLSERRIRSFAPSAIALHPVSGDLFVLSSSAQCLIIFDSSNKLKSIQLLDKKVHRQPEGICFDTDCNLYISNEAKNKIAMLYVYHPKF